MKNEKLCGLNDVIRIEKSNEMSDVTVFKQRH